MRCPFCGTHEDKVMETRVSRDGSEIRRRRECEGCARRYTTYERIEESMPLVIKNDGRREPFDRAKIEHGIQAAVAKRPVPRDKVAGMALEVEREIAELGLTEIASRDIGERVLPRLRVLDQVAYVRYASIYRDFRDLEGFEKELSSLRSDDTGRHELPDLSADEPEAAPDATIDQAREENTDRHHLLDGDRS
ncbi:MAG: transcriptional regulator NrdR [Deltaproteobacteria bacterium]|nr:transcriptional regulator NrdR [Deltaproteobacteria bacterium]